MTYRQLWCAEQGRAVLPPSATSVADYLAAHESRLRPSTLARRVASLGTIERLTGVQAVEGALTQHPLIKVSLKGIRRRRGGGQKQAAALRFGRDLDPSVGKGFSLSVLLAAHIDPELDGTATLFIPSSKTDQEGQGAYAWLSAETMRRPWGLAHCQRDQRWGGVQAHPCHAAQGA